MSGTVAEAMASAASALLASLDEDQRRLAHWPFPSDGERQRWFYTPTDHGGVTLGALAPAQQRLAMGLLRSGLSRPGYVTASTIMGLENVLDEIEGWSAGFHHGRGRDPSRYYVRVFGDPGSWAWSWRFGGHHLSVSHLVVDGDVAAVTPLFFGADPARSPLLGPHDLRPLGALEDVARDLLASLDDHQRKVAVISPVAPSDIVGANRAQLSDGDGFVPLPLVWRGRFGDELDDALERVQAAADRKLGITSEHHEALRLSRSAKGLAVAAMNRAQRDRLEALVELYVGRVPDALAERELARLHDETFDRMAFAWAGGVAVGEPHYYRLQGPRVLIEYDNTQRDVNHAHAVWRNPEGDFGADVLAEHLGRDHRPAWGP